MRAEQPPYLAKRLLAAGGCGGGLAQAKAEARHAGIRRQALDLDHEGGSTIVVCREIIMFSDSAAITIKRNREMPQVRRRAGVWPPPLGPKITNA